jgi:hypothetical protein
MEAGLYLLIHLSLAWRTPRENHLKIRIPLILLRKKEDSSSRHIQPRAARIGARLSRASVLGISRFDAFSSESDGRSPVTTRITNSNTRFGLPRWCFFRGPRYTYIRHVFHLLIHYMLDRMLHASTST